MNKLSIRDILKTPLNIKRLPNAIDLLIEKRLRIESLNKSALCCTEKSVLDTLYDDHELIISLTTYGDRIHEVYLAIESVFNQTMRPNKVILWLSEEEFKNKKIPILLEKQVERGLDIKYCKDILSYKKLIPTLEQYPNANIITIDDDIIYPINMIENLYNSFLEDRESIHFNRGHKIKMKSSNQLESYSNWNWDITDTSSDMLNFPTGCWGVFYPANCFNSEVYNESVFMSICKSADDVWFKAMALLNNFGAKKVYIHNENMMSFIDINSSENQINPLSQTNIILGQNDVQLQKVFNQYDLYVKLQNK